MPLLHVTRLPSREPGCGETNLLVNGFRRGWWELVERENIDNSLEGFAMRRSRGVKLEFDYGSRESFSVCDIL